MSREAPADANQHRVTIAEVARFAGVSPTTVSHVLSGKRAVGAGTKVAVLEAIQQLGYRPNSVARSLRTRRSHMVAVIVPDLTNPFYSTLIRGLADELEGSGYGTYIGNTDARAPREQAFLDDALDRGVDGMVFASTSVATRPEDGPAGTGTPVVCVGGAFDHPSVDLVTPDDEVGSRVVVAHLVARGAKRIAMIQGPAESGTARDHGYRHALTDAGLTFSEELMVRGDWTRRGGRAAMQQLMMLPERPDAVFCANDLTAIGAMDVARDLGVSIPGDVAIAGFDDIDAASMVHPTLTTVQNPGYDTGRGAGRMLVSRMSGAYTGAGRTVVLPCQLVVREST